MPPRDRKSDENATHKVYVSKRIPQQAYFPHRKKVVRRPVAQSKNAQEKLAMTLSPHKMKTRVLKVEDSEFEDETDIDIDGVSDGGLERRNLEVEEGHGGFEQSKIGSSSRKRLRDTVQAQGDDSPQPKYSKRSRGQRQTLSAETVHGRDESETEDDENETLPAMSNPRRNRRTRNIRQSTMTQFVDGRRPCFDDEEPSFKRASKSRTSKQDQSRRKDQRTLTQMIPDLRPVDFSSDDSMEETDSEAEEDEVGRLARLAPPLEILRAPDRAIEETQKIKDEEHDSDGLLNPQTLEIARDIKQEATPQPLTTSDQYRGRVIASSQSPASSRLSTPSPTPTRSQTRAGGTSRNLAQPEETPSKRRRVTFETRIKTEPPAPLLRKFRSVVKDSEDEDDDLLDEHLSNQADNDSPQGARQSNDTEGVYIGSAVGAETQAILAQIDDACALVDNEAGKSDSETSSARVAPSSRPGRVVHEHIREQPTTRRHASSNIKMEPADSDDEATKATVHHSRRQQHRTMRPTSVQTRGTKERHHSPTYATQTGEFDPSPVTTTSRDLAHSRAPDLEDSLSESSQRSSTQSRTQSAPYTAEQQLHHEWSAYSQNLQARSSELNFASTQYDGSNQAAASSPQQSISLPQQAHNLYSQATTVDEVTPKKNRAKERGSAYTTPHRFKGAQSQPFVSPIKPPPLFIPSSFPSPAKVRMSQWSSPVYGRSQYAFDGHDGDNSIENFSIPPPPPPDASQNI